MLYATTVSTKKELEQIQILNQQNLKQNLSEDEMLQEGFVSWNYSFELLEKMHQLAPSAIVKDGDEVIGYALVTLKEARCFHVDFEKMITNLQPVIYEGKPLMSFHFYLMGQVCIHKNYRGKGVFPLLFQQHKISYGREYDLLVTEISAKNQRSLKAHEKVGFKNIFAYSEGIDEWNVVVWNWLSPQR
jgi:GNAT superfamily N-acetyltransferase